MKSRTVIWIVCLSALGIFGSFILTNGFNTEERIAAEIKSEVNKELLKKYNKDSISALKEILANPDKYAPPSIKNFGSPYTIDPIIFNKAYDAIFSKDAKEIIRFADLYPDEAILQYLSIVNCTRKKFDYCTSERFSERLIKIDPSDAAAKSLLVAHYLKTDEPARALAELNTVKSTDAFKTYFPELTQALAKELKDHEEYKDNTKNELYIAAIGISAAQGIDTSLLKYCISKIESKTPNEIWLSSCKTYSKAMLNSKSMVDQSLSLALTKAYFKIKNQTKEYEITIREKEKMDKTIKAFGAVSLDDSFNTENNLADYFTSVRKLGEYRAMNNYLQNNKEQILEKYK